MNRVININNSNRNSNRLIATLNRSASFIATNNDTLNRANNINYSNLRKAPVNLASSSTETRNQPTNRANNINNIKNRNATLNWSATPEKNNKTTNRINNIDNTNRRTATLNRSASFIAKTNEPINRANSLNNIKRHNATLNHPATTNSFNLTVDLQSMSNSKPTGSAGVCLNRGIWINQYYQLSTPKDDCRAFVSRLLQHSPRKEWLFVGDSTMRRLVTSFRDNVAPCETIKKCDDCELSQYIATPLSNSLGYYKTYVDDNLATNGSINHMDQCKGWWSAGTTGCANRLDACRDRRVEYIAVPVAFDEQESTTNQFRYALLRDYLKSHPKDVCVINSGLHDEARHQSTNQYIDNVRNYLHIFTQACRKIIWISINVVKGVALYAQRNEMSLAWNTGVREMIGRTYPDIAYIDMFPMSTLKDMHEDNVHLNATYYETAARFFT